MLASVTDKQLRLIFYSTWLALLLVQCARVGLSGDEAYYWRYSLDLAWGYFDHPPLTAALTKAGYFLFPNELGVRFLFALVVTGLIYAMEWIVRPANLKLFYSIILSVAVLHIGIVWGGGMMALPDFPLLLFEALFFLVYKEYLDRPRLVVYFLLPLITALMLLSKYHGILVVGFVALSNPVLLRRLSSWLMAAGTMLLLMPHILWQMRNGFPSLRYHFIERSTDPYTIKFTLEYLGALPFILGPVVSIVLIYCAIVFRPQNSFDRAMKFTALGTFAFFLLMTFKGRVEGNWIFIALVPLVYLGYQYIESRATLKRLTRYCFVITLVLLLPLRAVLIARLPVGNLTSVLSPWTWTQELNAKTGGIPVGFVNSYQMAALYEFYEGVPGFSLNNMWGRKNQYTIWDTEADFQGQPVAVLYNWERPEMDSVRVNDGYFPFRIIDNFRSAGNLTIASDLGREIHALPSSTLQTKLTIDFANSNARDLDADRDNPMRISYGFFQGTKYYGGQQTTQIITNEMIGTTISLSIQVPDQPGEYSLSIGVATDLLPAGINGPRTKVIVDSPSR
jgi:hypothetical protein